MLMICLAIDRTFFPGRCADVILTRDGKDLNLGTFGVVHPEVLKNYDLVHPCSLVEIGIEPLV
jgi:phenylalanyl-tRNA synthetase beta chain